MTTDQFIEFFSELSAEKNHTILCEHAEDNDYC